MASLYSLSRDVINARIIRIVNKVLSFLLSTSQTPSKRVLRTYCYVYKSLMDFGGVKKFCHQEN